MVGNDRQMFCHSLELVAAGSLLLRRVSARNTPISVNVSACVLSLPVVYPFHTDFVVIEVNLNYGKI